MSKTVMILHSANELFGADLVLLRAVKAFQKKNIQPVVLLPDDLNYEGLLQKELEKINVKVYCCSLGILRRKYLTLWRLPFYCISIILAVSKVVSLIKKEKVASVYSMTSAVLSGALAAKLTKRMHIYHVHEILTRPKFLVQGLSWWMHMFADKVIVVSKAVRDHWGTINPKLKSKMVVIHNGLDMDYYVQSINKIEAKLQLGIDKDEIVIGCLGRIGSWKGQEILLDAIAALKNNFKNIKCLIGGGPIPGQEYKMEQFENLIKTKKLETVVIMKSFQKDVRPWLQSMDMLIVPSVKPDPFPTVVLEGMAFELPVIGARHGGIIEMIDDTKSGFLFEPGNSHDLARCITRALENPSNRIQLGQEGKKRLKEFFPLEKFERELIDVF